MGPLTVGFGVLFIALGLVGYFFAQSPSPTALIPAGFGLAFILLGLLARGDRLRMHVMHLAALLGLVGFAFPAYRVVKAAAEQDLGHFTALSLTMHVLFSLGSLVFVVLCVKSFVDARRRRRAAGEGGQAG